MQKKSLFVKGLLIAISICTAFSLCSPALAVPYEFSMAASELPFESSSGFFQLTSAFYGVNSFSSSKNFSGNYTAANGGAYYNLQDSPSWKNGSVDWLRAEGILYGIKTATNEYIIPTVGFSGANPDSSLENCLISGKDALGLIMIRAYPLYVKGVRIGDPKDLTRSSSYERSLRTFAHQNGIDEESESYRELETIYNSSKITNAQVCLLFAHVIEFLSGELVELEDYSSSEVGRMVDGSYIDTWVTDPSSSEFIDTSDCVGLSAPLIQAISLLYDTGNLSATTQDGVKGFTPNVYCTYDDYYNKLVSYHISFDPETGTPETLPTEISKIYPSISVSSVPQQVNYHDFLYNNAVADVSVVVDASGTKCRQPMVRLEYGVEDPYGNVRNTVVPESGLFSGMVQQYSFTYTCDQLGVTEDLVKRNNGNVEFFINYDYGLTVVDSLGTSVTENLISAASIYIVNNEPQALFSAKTVALANPDYESSFFYAASPISIEDMSSDYEAPLTQYTYLIKSGETLLARISDFGMVQKSAYFSQHINELTVSGKTLAVTFLHEGVYTVEATVVDEMGASSTFSKELVISCPNASPQAQITGPGYAFVNTDVEFIDASVDNNNDIVSALWSNGARTCSIEHLSQGGWVNVTDNEAYYVGSVGSYSWAAGATAGNEPVTLRFVATGTYRLHLTVTDAMGNSSSTSHEISIVDDVSVPVPDISASEQTVTCSVSFINTDGNVSAVQIPFNSYLDAGLIPEIVDKSGVYEHGWTIDKKSIVDPSTVRVTKDITFFVFTTDIFSDRAIITISFVNTDGEITSINKVPGYVSAKEVPEILNLDHINELGWTYDGIEIVNPTEVLLTKDTVFWVLTEDPSSSEVEGSGIPYFDVLGILNIKQNRAVTIDFGGSPAPADDPIIPELTTWELVSVNGYDLSNVKVDGNSFSGASATFMAKEPGEFMIAVTLHNNYSYNLAQVNPDNPMLAACTKTISVIVHEDVPPKIRLDVSGASPEFKTAPDSATISVFADVQSFDGDPIGRYEWSIVQDTNADGIFSESAITTVVDNELHMINFTAPFNRGAPREYLATLTAIDTWNQPTLSQYVSAADYASATQALRFTVNWKPSISFPFLFNGNNWAYTDDVITIRTTVADEDTSTCSVEWELLRFDGAYYEVVDTTSYDVWNLNSFGGRLMIPVSGNYVLRATVTDSMGEQSTFTSELLHVYDLPTAVIAEDTNYCWLGKNWTYKQSRRFDLHGNDSYATKPSDVALHEIDHSLDSWSIRPLSGNAADVQSIYILAGDGVSRLVSEAVDTALEFVAYSDAFNEQMMILSPGTYEVSYQVTNTYGKKSKVATQVITITEDSSPLINLGNPENRVVLGADATSRFVVIGLPGIVVSSKDFDIVGLSQCVSSQYRYDSNNNGDYTDEVWKNCSVTITPNAGKTAMSLSMTANVNQVGHYQFKFTLFEQFGQETIDCLLPSSAHIIKEEWFEVEVDNVAPQATFSTSTVSGSVDIVFAMGDAIGTDVLTNKISGYENTFAVMPGLSNMNIKSHVITTAGNISTIPEAIVDLNLTGDTLFIVWAEGSIPKALDQTSDTYNTDFADLVSGLHMLNPHLIILGSHQNELVMTDLLGRMIKSGTFVNTAGDVSGGIKVDGQTIIEPSTGDTYYARFEPVS